MYAYNANVRAHGRDEYVRPLSWGERIAAFRLRGFMLLELTRADWRFINTFAPWLSAVGTIAAVLLHCT